MDYLPNSYDPIPTPSPQGEGSPAAQAAAVASAVAFSPSRGSQPCRPASPELQRGERGRLEGVYDISHMIGFESK